MNRYPALTAFFVFASGIFLETFLTLLSPAKIFFVLSLVFLTLCTLFFSKAQICFRKYSFLALFLLAGITVFQIKLLREKHIIQTLFPEKLKAAEHEGYVLRKIHSPDNNKAILEMTGIHNEKTAFTKPFRLLAFFPKDTLKNIEKSTPLSFSGFIQPLDITKPKSYSLLSQKIRGLAFIKRKKHVQFHRYLYRQTFFQELKLLIQNQLQKTLTSGFSSREAENIYLALILGKREGLSMDMENKFQQTGTFHIFSISGLHFATVVFSFLLILKLLRLNEKTIFFLLTGFSLFYLFLTGARVSSLRAFTMMMILFAGRFFYREYNSLNALGVCGLLMLSLNPFFLFTPGFQLSFSAVLGIVIMTKWLSKTRKQISDKKADLPPKNITVSWKNAFIKNIAVTFSVCFSAWFFTLPVLLFHFKEFSLISSAVNVVIVPLAAAIISLGVFSCFLSLIFPFASMLLNMLAEKIILLLMFIIDFFCSSFPFVVQGDKISACLLLTAVCIMTCLFIYQEEALSPE